MVQIILDCIRLYLDYSNENINISHWSKKSTSQRSLFVVKYNLFLILFLQLYVWDRPNFKQYTWSRLEGPQKRFIPCF